MPDETPLAQQRGAQADWRPIPDPTDRTKADSAFALKAERDYTDGQLEVLRQRLNAIDKATELLNEQVNRVPTDLQKATEQIQAVSDQKFQSVNESTKSHAEYSELHFNALDGRLLRQFNELDIRITAWTEQFQRQLDMTVGRDVISQKFDSVKLQFLERDTRAERESALQKVALDAAFKAQQDAASNQDVANQKAIDKSELATQKTIDALSGNITDLKDRITIIESVKAGAHESKAAVYATAGLIGTVFLLLNTAIALYAVLHGG